MPAVARSLCPGCGQDVPRFKRCDQCGALLPAGDGGPAADPPSMGSGARNAGTSMVSAAELAAAAKDEAACLNLARRLAGGSLDGLLKAGEGAPDFLWAYARAFLRLGEWGAALAMAGAVRAPGRREHDFRVILERAAAERREMGLFQGAHLYRAKLGAMVQLDEKGLHAEAFCVLDDEMVRTAALDEIESMQVARVCQAVGRAADFAAAAGRVGDAGIWSPYARAFFALKDHATALALLARKKPLDPADYDVYVACHKALGRLDRLAGAKLPDGHRLRFARALMDAGEDRAALDSLLKDRVAAPGLEDYVLALRLCQRLGDFEAASRIFEDAQDAFLAKDAPELYYYFGILCEKAGRLERAREAYQKILKRIADYKDAAARLANLARVSEEDKKRLTALTTAFGEASPGAGAAQAAPGRAPAAPVRIAGKFEVQKTLGFGGQGYVYKAWHPGLSCPVAVKRMLDHVALIPAARQAFIREAKTVARLRHPYIVSIQDVIELDREIYLVFEYVDGETLQEVLAARGRLPPAESVRVLEFVCQALDYAHKQGVVHRDLKPGNVMVDRLGYVKLMDFGIAVQAGGSAPEGTGYAMGTLPYMAPEQCLGRATAQSDIFSLGATLYELLSGRPAFVGQDAAGCQSRKMAEAYAPLGSEVPPGLRDLAARCLKPDPSSRPRGAGEVLAALRSAR